ncbi:chemotaxis protein CheB [Aerosticca soli]|uniref:protein-glutamate methylesterase n=1 Tax=Aerosticca soli TaxID=2010829 RepID=A0A2Z6E6B6_9GAMM|nr:chemotaxis protein CheB [Aerosticca soli]BBD80098.1 chemotaxis response regulator protein-glutamate methylesterase CheB [Aerosticca soli]
MDERETAVALLFDDDILGAHLREALQARGARIVHEGPLSGIDRGLLDDCGAEVLVVNLDETDEGSLERLYAAVEDLTLRIVFNDAEASRGLEGWDRARWARHLALKVLERGELDPPRPRDARPIEAVPGHVAGAPSIHADDVIPFAASPADFERDPRADQDAEALAAELEALLAAAEESAGAESDGAVPADSESPGFEPDVAFPVQDFSLSSATGPGAEVETPAAPRPSDSWTLVDDDAPGFPAAATGEDETPPASVQLSREAEVSHPEWPAYVLVDDEDDVPARNDTQPVAESWLDEAGLIERVVVIGAEAGCDAAVETFLQALPVSAGALLVHVQQESAPSDEALAARLAAGGAWPVRVATSGGRARQGEVLIVPSGQQCELGRDGRIALHPLTARHFRAAAIDANFTALAHSFGRDLVAILFAGQALDAVGGCQAVHDRGGEVWLETAAVHTADVGEAVRAERLFHFIGTPRELAARLVARLAINDPKSP